ncbi:MAG TPA: YkgJ family cysteine cluster protein [Polyangiales bacterium]|nr:YkgJ family cysteine cluster protein [Polyangiales bacterium]
MKTPSDPRAAVLRNHKPSSKHRNKRAAPAGGAERPRATKPAKRSPRSQPPPKLRLPIVAAAKPASNFDCAQCGLCCTYVAIEIDGPTSAKRATELLWYLYHQGVSLYENDDSWMVQFETTCRFLTEDRRCGVYATRPHICREFSEQECEVNTGDGDGQTFYTPEAFMAHLKQSRPRVHALVMKGYAPPQEDSRGLHPFERRLRDVHVRRGAFLEQRGVPRMAAAQLPIKKSKAGSEPTDTL